MWPSRLKTHSSGSAFMLSLRSVTADGRSIRPFAVSINKMQFSNFSSYLEREWEITLLAVGIAAVAAFVFVFAALRLNFRLSRQLKLIRGLLLVIECFSTFVIFGLIHSWAYRYLAYYIADTLLICAIPAYWVRLVPLTLFCITWYLFGRQRPDGEQVGVRSHQQRRYNG